MRLLQALPFRFLFAVAFFASGIAMSADPAPPRRPNVVFAFADDYGRYASAYGTHDVRPSVNRLIRTPNIDAVAAAGVLFLNAHVSSPSCTPCRGALLSGRHFWQTGRSAILSGAVWDPAIPSYPLLLREAGYHIGKSHKVWSPGTPADAPYGGRKHASLAVDPATGASKIHGWPHSALLLVAHTSVGAVVSTTVTI